MDEPVTTLDSRFSDPDAEPVSWDETRRLLAAAQLFWIATVRHDGSPHVTPLVAVWLDDAIFFSTGPGEQKAINLAQNPRVVLTTGRNDWDQGVDVAVEGEAVRVSDSEQLNRLADAWKEKWDGRWRYTTSDGHFKHADGGKAIVFSVQPTKVLAFGKGTFTHTRHRFRPRPDR